MVFVTFQSYLLLFYQKLDIILSLIKQSQDVDRINIKTLTAEQLVCWSAGWLLFTEWRVALSVGANKFRNKNYNKLS